MSGPLARVLIVTAYVVVFLALLPAGLWTAAQQLDRLLPTSSPHPLLALPWFLVGAWLWTGGMLQLWRGGGGLPVSALPPPRFTKRGVYRFVRHPIYLGFQLLLVGAGLLLGSAALTGVVAPAFLPCWILYATVEERGLVRRFGAAYVRYRQHVGLLPRAPLLWLSRVGFWLLRWPIRVEGGHHVPKSGPVVLVANHASYLDSLFLSCVTRRPVRFIGTAEAFRTPLSRWVMNQVQAIPMRRYAPQTSTLREWLRVLEDGEVVGFFPSGERSVLGRLQPPLPAAARLLSKLPCPIIPVGIAGSYNTGPRWAGTLRRSPVALCVGPPVAFDRAAPDKAILSALEALAPPSAAVTVSPAERQHLERVLWRCPGCMKDDQWDAARLTCGACGVCVTPTADGLFSIPGRGPQTLADVCRPTWEVHEALPLCFEVSALTEDSVTGPLLPLRPLGVGTLELSRESLAFMGEQPVVLPLTSIRSVTTERADTLQVATACSMWQFRFSLGSAFRFCSAVERLVR